MDDVVLVDDRSKDETVQLARQIGIKHVILHEKNLGYGGNQKSCYNKALELGADIVIMLHPGGPLSTEHLLNPRRRALPLLRQRPQRR